MKPVEKMSYKELREAQKRHKKTLANKSLLQKLPDKGKKLLETQQQIDDRLLHDYKEANECTDMFAGMKISCPRGDVNQTKWTGTGCTKSSISHGVLSSKTENEEDERDIVNILALLTTNQMSKIVIDESVSPSDSSRSSSNNPSPQNPFHNHLVEKVEKTPLTKNNFKPFKSLKHEKPPPAKVRKWDGNAAAILPIFKFRDGVRPIHIEESLHLQAQAEEKFKMLKLKRSGIAFCPESVVTPEETEEMHDEEPEGERKGIAIINSHENHDNDYEDY